MATKNQRDIQPSNSSDALFRAWCVFLRDAVLNGWVQTSDTGQMDFTTVTAPGAANTKKGYIIVRMDDALQGSFPVYMRIDFGSGNVTNSPGIWLEIGTGSNGSGTITGSVFANGATTHIYTGSNGTGRTNSSHSSTSTSHVAVTLFLESTATFGTTFSVERGRDSAGAMIGTHVFLQYAAGASAGTVNQFHYLVRSGGTQVGAAAAAVITCPFRPAHAQQDVGFGVVVPQKPGSGTLVVPAPPCLGYIGTEGDSWTTDAVIIVYMYGVPVVYRRLHNFRFVSVSGNAAVSSHVFWQRYD